MSHVIAHDNVHKRLVKKYGVASAYSPRVSFDQTVTLYFNNEQAHIAYFAHAHTDDDAVAELMGCYVHFAIFQLKLTTKQCLFLAMEWYLIRGSECNILCESIKHVR